MKVEYVEDLQEDIFNEKIIINYLPKCPSCKNYPTYNEPRCPFCGIRLEYDFDEVKTV